MPNYLCIHRSLAEGGCQDVSPAKMEEMYAVFNSWREKFDANIVDLGGKLGAGNRVTSDGATDGPFVEGKEIVGGFMIIQAKTLEEANAVVRESPGVLMPGASVEIREIQTL